MKRSDVAMIVLVAAISVGVAFLVVGSIPGLSLASDASEKVKTIDRYEAEISEPNPDVFNGSAVNPTVDITIGESGALTESN